jgi:putative endonuclease
MRALHLMLNASVATGMHYVYILTSASSHSMRYTGYTQDLRTRFAAHNAGQNESTRSGRPWHLAAYFAFPSEAVARAFEKYLKTGSGKTFTLRHFVAHGTRPPPNKAHIA